MDQSGIKSSLVLLFGFGNLDRKAPVGISDDQQRDRESEVRNTDRKSTRLNSSHLVISYAVFSLKKKKKRPTSLELRWAYCNHKATHFASYLTGGYSVP